MGRRRRRRRAAADDGGVQFPSSIPIQSGKGGDISGEWGGVGGEWIRGGVGGRVGLMGWPSWATAQGGSLSLFSF